MTAKLKNKTCKGAPVILAMPIIIALMILPLSLCAESNVPQEEAQAESVFPVMIAQVQPESGSEEIGDDSDDLEDLEAGEEMSDEETVSIADPLQPWNRMWYHFNDKAYFWMFKPMAQGYRVVVPEGFRVCFSNFYTNATAPVRIFNNLFQLKFEYFFKEFARFLINTTVGFVGFRDCAKDCYGIKPHDEDFGQTLGHYRIGHGIYLVWPLLGPSSVRDTIGKGADSVLSFTGILSPVDLEVPVWVGLKTHEIVNEISLRIGAYEAIKEAAIDPYIAIRDGYAQRRKKAVQE
jgi:phospholipid-binding lipoprotein MlaA